MRLNSKEDVLQPLDLEDTKQNYDTAVNHLKSQRTNRTYAEEEVPLRPDSIQVSADDNKPMPTIFKTARPFVSERETRNHSQNT